MQISALDQVYLFIIFVLIGSIIGIVFDIFRIIRKTIRVSNFITYIQDILFCIIGGFIVIYSIFIFNKGELRAYEFIAIFIGIVFYFLTISKYFVIIGFIIGNFIKNVTIFVLKLVINLFKKLLFKPITFISINIHNINKFISFKKFHNIPKKLKK